MILTNAVDDDDDDDDDDSDNDSVTLVNQYKSHSHIESNDAHHYASIHPSISPSIHPSSTLAFLTSTLAANDSSVFLLLTLKISAIMMMMMTNTRC